eukprot:TRINITY_DN6811_c0_g1_i2.p1 TRINITY_DN6811_c0_g1~~TRINITY_DN6811_c0_g1_i2.p1  ORF type:complete len:105 (+),score=11.74 TRINITY_DN6811_c0_g1_i2:322-636(+)
MCGCLGNSVACVAVLLRHGADIEHGNRKGERPLEIAANKGNEGVVRLLQKVPSQCFSGLTQLRQPHGAGRGSTTRISDGVDPAEELCVPAVAGAARLRFCSSVG